MKPLTAATHFWALAGTHRVDASWRAGWYRSHLEAMQFGIARREYNFEISSCALRQDFVTNWSINTPTQASSSVSAFPNREWIALGCGRDRIVAKIIRKMSVGTRNAEAQS
jgi:hypothetical protein